MRAVKPEDQRPFVPLKQQPIVERIPAFDKIVDDAQADTRVQMRTSVSRRCGAHCGKDGFHPYVGETTQAPPKTCGGFELHSLRSAMLETDAGFFAAQLVAMNNATENASKLIDELTIQMNNARQAAITKELLEIVAGAEALGVE